MPDVCFKIGAVRYRIRPDMPLLLQIEEELGALPQLVQGFRSAAWSLADLVSLYHILLHHAGHPMDYMTLGNLLIDTGFAASHSMVLQFFDALHLPRVE